MREACGVPLSLQLLGWLETDLDSKQIEQVAALAVKGAEQILRKEVNSAVHADLLARLKTEL